VKRISDASCEAILIQHIDTIEHIGSSIGIISFSMCFPMCPNVPTVVKSIDEKFIFKIFVFIESIFTFAARF